MADNSAIFPADILVGYLSETSTVSATTLITIPAGRTWQGTISMVCVAGVPAAGTAVGVASVTVATAGTNVTPAAGTVCSCEALASANATGGTVGSNGNNAVTVPIVVAAPGANAVTVTIATFISGTSSTVAVTASGLLVASYIPR